MLDFLISEGKTDFCPQLEEPLNFLSYIYPILLLFWGLLVESKFSLRLLKRQGIQSSHEFVKAWQNLGFDYLISN